MKKSERLNCMLRFLSDKQQFHTSDLMKEFGVSKSTALRDIASLEEMGLALYSEPGRYGRYVLLSNKVLPAIRFTQEELFVLYLSLMTMKGYQTLPFSVEFSHIRHKFLDNVSAWSKKEFEKLEDAVTFENADHPYESTCLKEIIYSILENDVVLIRYKEKDYWIQFYQVSLSFNQWYGCGIDRITETYKVFRCDKITSLTKTDRYLSLDREQLKSFIPDFTRRRNQFRAEICSEFSDVFYKEKYPTIQLLKEDDAVYLSGCYDDSELPFILRYLSRYSEGIISLKPESLKLELARYFETQMKRFTLL